MQTIYAMHQRGSDDLAKEERFLVQSVDAIADLYLLMVSILLELRAKEIDFLEKSKNKFLATAEDIKPNTKFIDNSLLDWLSNHPGLQDELEQRHISHWQRNDDCILLLLQEMKQSDLYMTYMESDERSFIEDRQFICNLFEKVIAPNEILYGFLEDYRLTWLDDLPLVNTELLKQLQKLNPAKSNFSVPKPYKDEDDHEFMIDLFRKTVLNEKKLIALFEGKTPNWDLERIAEIDTILVKMALCEMLRFSSVPVKVTLNEYVEIAKEYSTPKSSVFLNGLLDTLAKELKESGDIVKTGRGLKE
ncbi:MAG: antitermination protein NusB [Flavobacterium sp. BFFFF2]|nr:MAG: antitermination protein NusB [Flavobacterium sp. BFFFF2]